MNFPFRLSRRRVHGVAAALASEAARDVSMFTRPLWESFGPGDVVETGYGVINVDEFNDELDAEATT